MYPEFVIHFAWEDWIPVLAINQLLNHVKQFRFLYHESDAIEIKKCQREAEVSLQIKVNQRLLCIINGMKELILPIPRQPSLNNFSSLRQTLIKAEE